MILFLDPIGEAETLIRRSKLRNVKNKDIFIIIADFLPYLAIDVHAGDIDASLSFTIWVYDMWINDLIKSGADPNYVKEVKSLFDLFKQRRCTMIQMNGILAIH